MYETSIIIKEAVEAAAAFHRCDCRLCKQLRQQSKEKQSLIDQGKEQ